MRKHVNVPVHPDVARAIEALALPGERLEDTVARIVWAFGTAETREREEPRAPRR